MSMESIPAHDYGLILSHEMVAEMFKKAKNIDCDTANDYEEGEDYFMAEVDGVNNWWNVEGGYLYTIEDSGSVSDFTEFDLPTDFLIVGLNNIPSLFNVAYESVNDIVNELKDRVGKYLPDDFDYRKYLVEFIGSICA